jgi:hypothetical protein
LKSSKRSWRLALPVLVMLFAGTSVASAATFQYGNYSVVNEQNVTITYGTAPINPAISGEMGQIKLYGSGPNSGQTLLAWCLDIYHYLANSGTYQIDQPVPSTPFTATQINQIGSLIQRGNALINTKFDVSAAIQLAIWEVIYPNLAFTVPSALSTVAVLAAEYKTNVGNGGIWYCPTCSFSMLDAGGNQTLGFGSPVPLPAALPLFGSGLVGLGVLGWRRRRKSASAV